MTTPTITIGNAPNQVPPGESISVPVTVTPGTGGGLSIVVGDVIRIVPTLPAGFSVANPEALQFAAPAAAEPFNLTLNVAGSAVQGVDSISWTWQNLTQGQATPHAGTAFSVEVGFSNTATLVYNATAVPPTDSATLSTAMANASLGLSAIQTKVGCSLVSDVVGGNVHRTIVFSLTYPVVGQFNGGSPLPANTTTKRYLAVTTSGGNANIGDLIYDNGKGTGTAVVVAASTNRTITIATAADISGGTQSFTKGHKYTWSGGVWNDNGVSTIGKSAFQANFPMAAGAQASPFKQLYQASLAAYTGGVVTSAAVVIAS